MEAFYILLFAAIAATTVFFELGKGRAAGGSSSSSSSSSSLLTRDFVAFRNNYVLVYALMMAGDWLQGPYVYALYQHYGFDRGAIGRLFIAGFGSSMVFGTFVGAAADRTGRKKAALTYVAAYSLGCFTKHSASFSVLLVGRLLCGVATSLLYSAFESWLVAEHFRRGYDSDLLGGTFAKAVFIGNGLVAIVAGLLAHVLVETLALGPTAPFDAAAMVLTVGGLIVATTWPENFGEQKDPSPASAAVAGGSSASSSSASASASPKRTFAGQLQHAASAIAADPKIALLGAMQALFEGAMYTFVFLWTPALSPRGDEKVPHGFVFALFMVSSMAGSAFAGKLLTAGASSSSGGSKSRIRPEKYMQLVFAAAACALAIPALFHTAKTEQPAKAIKSSLAAAAAAAPRGISFQGKVQLLAFCAFEALVGVFWPSMMKMRSAYVPEESRATIINFFRIPLNAFVCVILYNVSAYPLSVMFGMCSLFLATAAVCQRKLDSIVTAEASASAGHGSSSNAAGANSNASRPSPSVTTTRSSTATATIAMGSAGGKVGSAPQHPIASPARRV